MSLHDDLKEQIHWYVAKYVDQMIESVFEFYDDSFVAGDEEDGFYIHAKVRVSYVVHPDLEPRRGVPNLRHFWFDGDALYMIAELDRARENDS